MRSFIKGFKAPLTALRHVLTTSGLKRYMLMPFLCSVIFISAMGACWKVMLGGMLGLIPEGPYWHWVGVTLQTFSWLAFGIVSAFCFSLVGMILASPFNDLLCQKVLRQRGVAVPATPFLQGAWNSLRDALQLTLLKGLVLLLSLLLPGLSLVCYFLFVGVDHFDYPWSYKARGLVRKMSLVFETSGEFCGFVLSYGLLYMVPFLGVFVMPLAVVSASLMAKMPGAKGGR